jgi:transposase
MSSLMRWRRGLVAASGDLPSSLSGWEALRGSGSASYHPKVLLGLLVYGYATGVFSNRKLERATYDSVPFRFIAANDHPDHDTIAVFRRHFVRQIEGLFMQVLLLAREMGVLKLGTVALDGTKIHANASRHSALSYEHEGKIQAQLQAEVADLMAKAEAADQADLPDGFSIPEELARREERLGAWVLLRMTWYYPASRRFLVNFGPHDETGSKKPGGINVSLAFPLKLLRRCQQIGDWSLNITWSRSWFDNMTEPPDSRFRISPSPHRSWGPAFGEYRRLRLR